MKSNKIAAAVFIFAFVFSPYLKADLDPMAELRNMVKDLQKTVVDLESTVRGQAEEIKRLRDRKPEVQAGPSAGGEAVLMSDYEFNDRLAGALGGANKWLKDLTFKGDLRFRYEAFEQSSGHPSETDDRNRFRFRLRYGFGKKFNEDLTVVFYMASAEQSAGTQSDVTSTNTTFDGLFNFKDIFIERAFMKYSPAFLRGGVVEKTTILAGKIQNPFEKGSSDMIWDRDVRPEGVAEIVDINVLDSRDLDVKAYAQAGQFILDEDATIGGDSEMFAHQAGINAVFYTPMLEGPVDVHIAGSWYSYHDYEEFSNFGALARGNVNVDGDATQLDAKDFEVIALYNEVAINPMGMSVRGFFEIAGNPADRSQPASVGGENMAFSFGAKLGGIVKKGDWELGYAYKRIEANSVAGAFNDSDFGTTGHAGKRGSVFKGAYALTDNIQLNAAAIFVNNLNTGTVTGLRDEEQKRFQLDTVLKF